MINTYNLFATVVVHGKLPLDLKLHKKIINYVNTTITSSSTCERSVVNGHQFHNDFDGKQELDNFLNNYFLNTYRLKIVNSWLNVLSDNSYNRPHSHGGDTVCSAAVFYLSGNSNNITLVKDTQTFEIKPKLFDYILFPYDLVHYVLPENRNEYRISYAFNLEKIKND